MVYAATKESAHALIERMEPGQLEIVIPLLAVIVDPLSSRPRIAWEDEEIGDEENEAVARARMETGPGTSLAELMVEMGISQDELDNFSDASSPLDQPTEA